MTEFDAAGGPWGYRLRYSPAITGFDLSIEAGTFTGQALPQLQGTIPDQTIYAGAMADGETYLQRHNWYNQGSLYRATVANYPAYPGVTVVDYHNLHALSAYLPELVVQPGGTVRLETLLPLLADPAVMANVTLRLALLALLSGCAVTGAQRTQLAAAAGLSTSTEAVLRDHGVLLYARSGTFTPQDCAVISATLDLIPAPVKDQLHLIVLDEALAVAGGYRSGGIIVISEHATVPGSFAPYPGGRQLPDIAWHLQSLLIHEIGHLCDASSVGTEARRYEEIFDAGASDPNAYLYGTIDPVPSEEIIYCFLGYCTDSATILNEVASRGNTILSQKLSHTIDLLPSVVPGTVPFYTTDPVTHATTMRLAPSARAPGVVLGDDGMITSVNGISF